MSAQRHTLKPLDLAADPLGAAIRARPPEPRRPVWIHVVDADRGINRWCVLREADHQIRDDRDRCITTLCCWPLPYELVSITTHRPGNTCPACETELAAWTPGAAVAVDPAPTLAGADPEVELDAIDDAVTEPRAITLDLFPAHKRVDRPAVWDGAPLEEQLDQFEISAMPGGELPHDGSAYDSLNDLRIPEEPC